MSGFSWEHFSGDNKYLPIDEMNTVKKELFQQNQIKGMDSITKEIQSEITEDFDEFSPNTHITDGFIRTVSVLMDVKEPLFVLRSILQDEVNDRLNEFRLFIQGTALMDESKNLLDWLEEYEGFVQVQCELSISTVNGPMISVTDVVIYNLNIEEPAEEPAEGDMKIYFFQERWALESSFVRYLQKLQIPLDPTKWNKNAVRYWLVRAVHHFNVDIDLSKWTLSVINFLDINFPKFEDRVKYDPFGHFWIHFQLLCTRRVIIFNKFYLEKINIPYSSVAFNRKELLIFEDSYSITKVQNIGPRLSNVSLYYCDDVEEHYDSNSLMVSGNVLLWKFLLEILTERRFMKVITWLEDEGEFKILNPHYVAHLWGLKKSKPNMTYEKFSRALRYYYNGDFLCKVPGQKFVYKFVCNLQQLIGYSSTELRALVKSQLVK